MAWVNQTKNTGTQTDQTKNSASSTNYLRHGKKPTLEQLADYVFTSVVFPDGTQLQDVSFAELVDAVWTNQSKND